MRGKFLFAGAAMLGVALFTALGVWQVQRLDWKRDLIARVESRAFTTPIPVPQAYRFDAGAHEYQRVTVRGQYLNDRETLVQAATRLGGGYWVMTPLRTDDGSTVLINRGFVTADQRQSRDWGRLSGEVTVTGLLRLTEPAGGFLRQNQPDVDRWYSRDVAAIAAARRLPAVAPYFIDADAVADAASPVGGLTVLRFRDNHLQYALTWFALALLLAGGTFRILRS